MTACRERHSWALPFVSFLETRHPVTGSCPPAWELLLLRAQSHAARNSKAATPLRHGNCRRWLGSFLKGQETLTFARTGWQNSAVLMITFSYLQWQHFIKQVRNTSTKHTKQKLLCLVLAQHPLYFMLKALFETRKQMSQVAHNSAITEAAAIKEQLN